MTTEDPQRRILEICRWATPVLAPSYWSYVPGFVRCMLRLHCGREDVKVKVKVKAKVKVTVLSSANGVLATTRDALCNGCTRLT